MMKRGVILVALFLSVGMGSLVATENKIEEKQSQPEFRVKDYASLLGMKDFEQKMLNMHFQLYRGYVKATNALIKLLENPSLLKPYEYGALKRSFDWEFNGMRFHELYFENLGGNGKLHPESFLYQQLAKQFGSLDAWKKDFIATGLIRGIGWVVLTRDPISKRLFNVWIDEHDIGPLAGGDPLLVMDVFEHAYLPQFGLDRKQYIEVFFNNINWPVVQEREKK